MQSVQSEMFFEDEFEALNLMISNSGKPFKEVASHVFPHRKPDSAYARLKACLNPDKDERLTFGEIISLMKFCECYEPLMYACDETLHARPPRISPRDEEMNLVNAIATAAGTLDSAMKKLEQLQRMNVKIAR